MPSCRYLSADAVAAAGGVETLAGLVQRAEVVRRVGREPVARGGLLAEREAAARVTVGHGPDESASAFALHADIPCLGASIYDVRSGWGRGSPKSR